LDHRWPADVTIPAVDQPLRERLRRLCDYARLAPSVRNSQPWRFVLGDSSVEVWADPSRALAVADPEGRGLTQSCGAALAFLEIAARASSLTVEIDRLPDATQPELLARLRIVGEAPPATEDPWLFQAIPKRRTHRGIFSGHAVSPRLLDRLRQLAESRGAPLRIVEGEHRRRLIEQVRAADREQRGDPAFGAELAAWVDPDRTGERLGIPAHRVERAAIEAGERTRLRRFAVAPAPESGQPDRADESGASGAEQEQETDELCPPGVAIDLMIDDLDALLSDEGAERLRILAVSRAKGTGAAPGAPHPPQPRETRRSAPQRPADDDELDQGSPVLAVLTTPGDDRASWLRAGETLARILLRGRVDHLWASFLGQGIEVASARAAIREALDLQEWPQVILRLGYAGDLAPTPRKALADLLTDG
jgi:nitroreductase